MKRTNLLILVANVMNELHRSGRSINAGDTATGLNINRSLEAYFFKEISKEGLIIAEAGHSEPCYQLTHKGELFCKTILADVNIEAVRRAYKEECVLWRAIRLSGPALKVLTVVQDRVTKGKKAWPTKIAEITGERVLSNVIGVLQRLEQKGLITSRRETAHERYVNLSTERRRLYEITDKGKALLEVFEIDVG